MSKYALIPAEIKIRFLLPYLSALEKKLIYREDRELMTYLLLTPLIVNDAIQSEIAKEQILFFQQANSMDFSFFIEPEAVKLKSEKSPVNIKKEIIKNIKRNMDLDILSHDYKYYAACYIIKTFNLSILKLIPSDEERNNFLSARTIQPDRHRSLLLSSTIGNNEKKRYVSRLRETTKHDDMLSHYFYGLSPQQQYEHFKETYEYFKEMYDSHDGEVEDSSWLSSHLFSVMKPTAFNLIIQELIQKLNNHTVYDLAYAFLAFSFIQDANLKFLLAEKIFLAFGINQYTKMSSENFPHKYSKQIVELTKFCSEELRNDFFSAATDDEELYDLAILATLNGFSQLAADQKDNIINHYIQILKGHSENGSDLQWHKQSILEKIEIFFGEANESQKHDITNILLNLDYKIRNQYRAQALCEVYPITTRQDEIVEFLLNAAVSDSLGDTHQFLLALNNIFVPSEYFLDKIKLRFNERLLENLIKNLSCGIQKKQLITALCQEKQNKKQFIKSITESLHDRWANLSTTADIIDILESIKISPKDWNEIFKIIFSQVARAKSQDNDAKIVLIILKLLYLDIITNDQKTEIVQYFIDFIFVERNKNFFNDADLYSIYNKATSTQKEQILEKIKAMDNFPQELKGFYSATLGVAKYLCSLTTTEENDPASIIKQCKVFEFKILYGLLREYSNRPIKSNFLKTIEEDSLDVQYDKIFKHGETKKYSRTSATIELLREYEQNPNQDRLANTISSGITFYRSLKTSDIKERLAPENLLQEFSAGQN